MAYENIALRKQNMTMYDGYFYMIDEDQDALVVKTDDGTQAFSYPLDTTLSEEIVSLEHDGRNFWTLENPGGDEITIRRWYIDNFILKIRNTFNKTADASHKYDSQAFTIEHYHLNFANDEAAAQGIITVYIPDTKQTEFDLVSELTSGMTVTLGPNQSGQVEELTVNSVSVAAFGGSYDTYDIQLNGVTTYAHEGPHPTDPVVDYPGDTLSFYSRIWVFNNYNGLDNSTGAIYQLNAYTGSYQAKYAGGAYKDVSAATFFDMSSVYGDGSNAIVYVKATNMLFLDPNDPTTAYGSMSMDNLEDDLATVIPLYDVAIEGPPAYATVSGSTGNNVYRLQRKATYYGTTYTFANSTYNYQLSTLDPFITSISLRANPAILPANGVNTATITAIVKDQFNLPIASKPVYFTDDDPDGDILAPNPAGTDANGVAITYYQAGITAREVKITATAQQG